MINVDGREALGSVVTDVTHVDDRRALGVVGITASS